MGETLKNDFLGEVEKLFCFFRPPTNPLGSSVCLSVCLIFSLTLSLNLKTGYGKIKVNNVLEADFSLLTKFRKHFMLNEKTSYFHQYAKIPSHFIFTPLIEKN